MSSIKLGRPRKGEKREGLRTLSFRVDAETADALARLADLVGPPTIRGRVSVVLRKLIRDASEKSKTESYNFFK